MTKTNHITLWAKASTALEKPRRVYKAEPLVNKVRKRSYEVSQAELDTFDEFKDSTDDVPSDARSEVNGAREKSPRPTEMEETRQKFVQSFEKSSEERDAAVTSSTGTWSNRCCTSVWILQGAGRGIKMKRTNRA